MHSPAIVVHSPAIHVRYRVAPVGESLPGCEAQEAGSAVTGGVTVLQPQPPLPRERLSYHRLALAKPVAHNDLMPVAHNDLLMMSDVGLVSAAIAGTQAFFDSPGLGQWR